MNPAKSLTTLFNNTTTWGKILIIITFSIPSTPLASVLAQIINSPSLHSILAFLAIYIFLTMSYYEIKALPSK